MHIFKHPKYYKELRKRNKSDQVISKESSTEENQRAPGPGLKQRDSTGGVPGEADISVTSDKQQASSTKLRYTPTGILLGVDLGPKPQAASKPEPVQVQASSAKRQASQPE